jgi:hypothetical protein
MTSTWGTRGRVFAATTVLAAALALLCPPGAASGATTVSSTSTTVPSRVQISSGLEFSGADVHTAGGKTTRRLTAYQAAVFVQAWIGAAFYTHPKHEKPPATAPIARVDVTGTWGGGTDLVTRPVFYASDGKNAYISFPPSADVRVGSLDFWIAPSRTIGAFAGTEKLVPTAGANTDTSSTPPREVAPAASSSSNSSWPWVVALALVVLVALAIGVVVRRGRRAHVASRSSSR